MDFLKYPFKQTEATQIKESFRKHIMTHFGGEEAYLVVEKAFERISQLRDSLNFRDVQISNLEQCCVLEKNIYKYLKYTQLLQNIFKFESWKKGRVVMNLVWTDSFRQNEVVTKTSNLRVEMCAILYNLAILLYYIGNLIMLQNSVESRKAAINKFRRSLWAIVELQKNLPLVFKEFRKTHLDFTLQNIVTIENIILGLSYACMFKNLEQCEGQIGFQHVAVLSGEANKHFQYALKITNEIFTDQNTGFSKMFLLQVKQYLYSQTIYYFCQTAVKMAKYHEKKNEQDKTTPHVGMAIAYLSKARGILQQSIKNIDNVLPSLQKSIQGLTVSIDSMYQEFIKKNSTMYNQQIMNENNLPSTQLQENMRMTALVPAELEIEEEDETFFKKLLSPDLMQIVKEVKKTVETNKQQAETSLKFLKDYRSNAYLANFVNGFLDILNQSALKNASMVLPQTIQQKIDLFQAKGGEKEVQRLISVLADNAASAKVLINEIFTRIRAEETEDETNRILYKDKWEVPTSSEANHSYIQRLKEFQQNLNDGEGLDAQSCQNYKDLKYYFRMLSKGAEYIQSKIPKGKDEQFRIEFNEQFQNMKNLDEQARQLIREQEVTISKIISSIDFQSAILEAQAKQLSMQQTIDLIIATANSIVDEICQIANFLNSKKMNSETFVSIKEIEKINNGIWRIIELQNELEQGLDFYKALFNAITETDSEVNDFLTSRNQQKENQMYIFQLQQKKQDQGGDGLADFVTDQPFFEDGRFPMGQSRYVEPKNFDVQSSEIDHTW